MSEAKDANKNGLRKEEVERNMMGSHNEIPYVPLLDQVDERKSISIKLPDSSKISVTEVHNSTNKELFLSHATAAKRAVNDLGLFALAESYEELLNKTKKLMKKNYQAEPVQGATVDEKMKDAYLLAKTKFVEHSENLEKTIKKMLSTFKGFLNDSNRPIFEEIIQKKIGNTQWVNLRGEEVTTSMGYTLAAYDMCWIFFMRTVFQQDAAEQLLSYMLYHLKKPMKVPVRTFCGRVSQMNNYVEALPSLYFSSKATTSTVMVSKLDEPTLAQLILRLSPLVFQGAYEVLRDGMPQNLEDILQFLETQERQEKLKVPAKPKESFKDNNKKRERPNHGNKPNKKGKKHCDLCAKNNGPANTHNTTDCNRYNPDGTKKGYSGKPKEGYKGKSNGDKKTHNNYSQLLEETRKEIKSLKKDVKRMKKRSNEESDSDSDA